MVKQERKGITIQLVIGKDDDLINVITNLPEKSRQQSLKDWLRQSQGFETAQADHMVHADHTEALRYLIENADWTKKQLIGLRPYLDDRFANITVQAASPFALASDQDEPPKKEGLSKEALAKRNSRIKRWD